MTYEMYVKSVIDNAAKEDKKIGRHEISGVSGKLILSSVAVGSVIANLVLAAFPSLILVAVLAALIFLALFLYSLFQSMAESFESFETGRKVSKFWWLLLIASVVVNAAVYLLLW